MALARQAIRSCSPARDIGKKLDLMAQLVQFAGEIEDVKPPGGCNCDFQGSDRPRKVLLGRLCNGRSLTHRD